MDILLTFKWARGYDQAYPTGQSAWSQPTLLAAVVFIYIPQITESGNKTDLLLFLLHAFNSVAVTTSKIICILYKEIK